ncbi:MAG: CBS domain-containing protein [Candidatus Peregrinibacteria bacterium]|nr:CBS domain-containing protein [Candidatus Peregrinibacteria bacterium]
MKKYIVSNYMNPKVVTLPQDATFKDAAKLMLGKHTNGIVIVDNENKVAGILSSWDLIQYLVPDYLEEDKHLASFEAGDTFSTRIDELANDPIMNFASKKVHTIKQTHSMMEASTLLSEFHIRQLPVVDDDDKLIGYLNRTDVKKAIGDVLKIKY